MKLPLPSPKTRPAYTLPVHSVIWRQEKWHFIAVFLTAFLLYGATTSNAVFLEDDALFIGVLHFWGVAHPPGYPAYTLLGGIFYHLIPFGTAAFKAHLFSGFAGGLTMGVLYLIGRQLFEQRVYAYLIGLSYAVSKTFWSQAIIAEVYTLNTLLFFLLVFCLLCYLKNTRSNQSLYWAAWVSGIGLANHHPLFILSALGLLIPFLPQLMSNIKTAVKVSIIPIITAIPFYGWMVHRSWSTVPANFYGIPLNEFDILWYYVLRQGYSNTDIESIITWQDKWSYAEFLLFDYMYQYTVIGAILVLMGGYLMYRSVYSRLSVAMLLSVLTGSISLIFLLDFKATFLGLQIFRVYHLIAYGFLAIWLTFGVHGLLQWVQQHVPLPLLSKAPTAITLLLVVGIGLSHLPDNNRSNDNDAEMLALEQLNSVDNNAVLFLEGDLDLPIGYLHFINNVRPDIRIYNSNGLIYGTELFTRFTPNFPSHENNGTRNGMLSKSEIIQDFILNTKRPIYYPITQQALFASPDYGSVLTGYFHRVNRFSNQHGINLSPTSIAWLQNNADRYRILRDPWTRQQYYLTTLELTNALLASQWSGATLKPEWQALVEQIRLENPFIRISNNLYTLQNNKLDDATLQQEYEWINSIKIDEEYFLNHLARADFYRLKALFVAKIDGENKADYEQHLLQSWNEYPTVDNPSFDLILEYYSNQLSTQNGRESRGRSGCLFIEQAIKAMNQRSLSQSIHSVQKDSAITINNPASKQHLAEIQQHCSKV